MLVVTATTLILGNLTGISAQFECKGDLGGIASQCQEYTSIPGPKIPPSNECCQVINDVDIPCLCKYVTKDIESIISVDKAIYVFKTCGAKVPAGTKCGSYIVPFPHLHHHHHHHHHHSPAPAPSPTT
ncbi:protein LIM3-like [Lotus japonicus]|uniref:protein LIM3-like n=1 Tax=Lotus japonicus TaxID=34305 RepID=UPI00258272FD|nr:protein LIM3-like [Lotus japonicus]